MRKGAFNRNFKEEQNKNKNHLPLAKQRSRYEAFFVEVQGTNLSSGGRILPEACKERQLEGREVKTAFMQCTKVDMQSQGIS